MTEVFLLECDWRDHPRRDRHTEIHLLEHVLHNQREQRERDVQIMADITGLAAELVTLQNDTDAAAARVQASLDALSAQVADLTAQIAALSVGAVTQDQIDALDASATAIDAGINAIDPTVSTP